MDYHWIKIFEKEENDDDYILKNTFINLELKGEKICITKTDAGIFAFGDKCPHNGASLSKGFCSKKNEIICPLHRYSFDLKSGKATSEGAFAIKTYPVKINEEGLFIGIKAKWWES